MSLTLLLRDYIECTSPTWQRYLNLMGLLASLPEEENE